MTYQLAVQEIKQYSFLCSRDN